MTSKAKADVEESVDAIAEMEAELQELSAEAQEQVEEIDERWDEVAAAISQTPVKPYKKDIYVSQLAIAWLPFHRVDVDGREMLLAAYEVK